MERVEQIKNGEANKEKPIVNFYDMSADVGNIRLEGGVAFNGGKKPEKLIKMLLDINTEEGDIVLDYHLGSGTTAAVALKMNRRFIGVEQMDGQVNLEIKRLKSVIGSDSTGISKDVNWQGGGSFIYTELMQKNINYIQEIQQTKKESELNNIFNKMFEQSADFDFRVDLSKYLKDVKDSDLSFEEKKKQLISIIDKNQLYYPYSQIDDQDIKNSINDNDIKFNKSFYESEDE